jgi:small GTP-binding protein
MGLNNTPLSERIHIGIFGRRNAGKSSVINVMTGQNLAIVSDVAGTTTDPVQKAMELLPLGPVVMIDTPGLDDVGELGKMRVEKAYQVLQKTDIAVIVIDASVGETAEDAAILAEIQKRSIPYIIVKNKADLTQKQDFRQRKNGRKHFRPEGTHCGVSTKGGEGTQNYRGFTRTK